jgi:hypothetical protein
MHIAKASTAFSASSFLFCAAEGEAGKVKNRTFAYLPIGPKALSVLLQRHPILACLLASGDLVTSVSAALEESLIRASARGTARSSRRRFTH